MFFNKRHQNLHRIKHFTKNIHQSSNTIHISIETCEVRGIFAMVLRSVPHISFHLVIQYGYRHVPTKWSAFIYCVSTFLYLNYLFT